MDSGPRNVLSLWSPVFLRKARLVFFLKIRMWNSWRNMISSLKKEGSLTVELASPRILDVNVWSLKRLDMKLDLCIATLIFEYVVKTSRQFPGLIIYIYLPAVFCICFLLFYLIPCSLRQIVSNVSYHCSDQKLSHNVLSWKSWRCWMYVFYVYRQPWHEIACNVTMFSG